MKNILGVETEDIFSCEARFLFSISRVESPRLVISFVEARFLIERNEKIAEIGDSNLKFGGATGIQTLDLRLAKAAL